MKLEQPAAGDLSWGTGAMNGNASKLDALAPLGQLAVSLTEVPSASLNVRVGSGFFRNAAGVIITYAGTASQAIPTASTRNLWLTDAGVLTLGTAWPTAGTNHVRLAIVVAGATTITSITDARLCFLSASS